MIGVKNIAPFAIAAALMSPFGATADEQLNSERSEASSPVSFEARFGVLYHEDSRFERVFGNTITLEDGGPVDITGELLAELHLGHSDNSIWNMLLTPAVRVGGTVNTEGGTSHANVGVAFDYDLPFDTFVEGTFGVAVHNGNLGDNPFQGRRLGCSPLAYMAGSAGVNVTEKWRVMFTAEHLDNFDLCTHNAQLTNLGLRIGVKY